MLFPAPYPHQPPCNVGSFQETYSLPVASSMHQAACLNSYLIPDELLSMAVHSQYSPEQDLAMMDEVISQQQLSTPTMHPNLVSTLKSIIATGPPLQYATNQPVPNPARVLAGIGESLATSSSESLFSSGSEVISQSISPEDIHKLYQCSCKFPYDPSGPAVVPVYLIQNRRPFKCNFIGCDKTFRNPQTLRMHHKTHYAEDSAYRLGAYSLAPFPTACKAGHNKKIPSKCPICERTFVGLYELRRHFGRKHSEGEKMHACRKCGKKFYIEVDLRDHEKLCGEPLHCKCGLKFAFKCNLVAHKRTHLECQDSEECKDPGQGLEVQGGVTDAGNLESKATGELNQRQSNPLACVYQQQQQQQISCSSNTLPFSACDQSLLLMESIANVQREDSWLQFFFTG